MIFVITVFRIVRVLNATKCLSRALHVEVQDSDYGNGRPDSAAQAEVVRAIVSQVDQVAFNLPR